MNFDSQNPAVLLIVLNRPDKTKKILDSILNSDTKRLYIASDGPRINNESDNILCKEVGDLINNLIKSKTIQIKTLIRTENLGCKVAVSSAIDWFFEKEQEGIILEDDTLPTPTFYKFCGEMLIKYRNDSRIGVVCGSNLISDHYKCENSYFFSKYNPIWGWATWKRAWECYDVNMTSWNFNKNLNFLPNTNYKLFYWNDIFNKAHNNLIDTWDYQWTYACWKNNLLSIIPQHNLIKNIGFDNTATHTNHAIPNYVKNNPEKDLLFPLIHPIELNYNPKIDNITEYHVYNLTFFNYLKKILYNNYIYYLWKKIK